MDCSDSLFHNSWDFFSSRVLTSKLTSVDNSITYSEFVTYLSVLLNGDMNVAPSLSGDLASKYLLLGGAELVTLYDVMC